MKMRAAVKALVDGAAQVMQRSEVALLGCDDDVVLDGFERHVQLDRRSCGAQVAFAVLHFFGRARSIERTTTLLGTDEHGTAWPAMRRLFRERRLATKTIERARKRDLVAALDANCPVVVSADAETHWAVLFGYGDAHVYLADPSVPRSPRIIVPWSTFMGRWDRWAGIVSPRSRRARWP